MIKPLDAPRLTVEAAATPTAGPRRYRVLLVDDESAILRALSRLLRREPYDLVTAASGDEALRLMGEDPADLILSDQRMPAMTGTELLRRVRDRWPDTVRIILSGYSEVHSILDAINEGEIYKYLTKPWNDEELRIHLRRALEQRELVLQNRELHEEIERQNRRLRDLNEQLDQRARDAIIGLTFSHEVIETASAGVVGVGSDGVVVSVNARASQLLGVDGHGPLGDTATRVLPEPLLRLLRDDGEECPGGLCVTFDHAGRRVQACTRSIRHGDEVQGRVLTLWEVIE